MHTPGLLSLPVFPPMDENLHDIRPHQIAHPPVCAKKGKEVRFSAMAVNRVLSALVDFARLRLPPRASPSRPHEPSLPFGPPSPPNGLKPSAPSDPPRPVLTPSFSIGRSRPCERRHRPALSPFVSRVCPSIEPPVSPNACRIPPFACCVWAPFGSTVSSSRTPPGADSLRSMCAFRRLFPCVVVVCRIRTRSSVRR